MLTIRSAQLTVFEKNKQQTFEDKLAGHLEAYLGAKGLRPGPEYIRDQIRRGLALCDDFGLDRQCDVARYFEIALGAAGGFTEEPLPKDAMHILYGYRVDPELKLKQFEAWAAKRGV